MAELYRTIVVDPPWRYKDKLPGNDGAESQYPCLTVQQISDLVCDRLNGVVADNAHLYLWATNSFMEEAHQLARVWGFRQKTILTWIKPRMGMGHYYRNNTEHVLFCVRGSLKTLRRDCLTAFAGTYRRHSEKPDEFFSIVESMSPGPRLELFARRERPGWDVWGNEVRTI